MLHSPTPDRPVSNGLEPAPFHAEIAEGTSDVKAWWVRASDGTRLRFGVWPEGPKGTVLMFCGRTEYVEKYGRVAEDLANAGYGMVSFDWRGQGLADRPQHEPGVGHVLSFDEYRWDVTAFRAALEDLGVPKPWYLIGHSMGGCIGLRALYDGLPVAAAAFTGPMWGIQLTPLLKLISPLLIGGSTLLGRDNRFALTTGPWKAEPFDGNILTTDPDQYAYMNRQTAAHPELTLGGPSFRWVAAAEEEAEALLAMPPLDLPVVTIVGSDERRVSIENSRKRMENWPRGDFLLVDGARHEVLMENPARRGESLAAIIGHFDAHGPGASA